MQNDAKRGAQDALFIAIKNQAETNMKAALRATEKAELLRDLAEAYRLTAGGAVPDGTARKAESARATMRKGQPADEGARKTKPADERARKAKSADERAGKVSRTEETAQATSTR
jgi:hypothetical protein